MIKSNKGKIKDFNEDLPFRYNGTHYVPRKKPNYTTSVTIESRWLDPTTGRGDQTSQRSDQYYGPRTGPVDFPLRENVFEPAHTVPLTQKKAKEQKKTCNNPLEWFQVYVWHVFQKPAENPWSEIPTRY